MSESYPNTSDTVWALSWTKYGAENAYNISRLLQIAELKVFDPSYCSLYPHMSEPLQICAGDEHENKNGKCIGIEFLGKVE